VPAQTLGDEHDHEVWPSPDFVDTGLGGLAFCLFGDDIPEGGMEPLRIGVSFDGGEQVVPGGIPGFGASLVREVRFQTSGRCPSSFPSGASIGSSPPPRESCANRRRRIGCRDRNGGSGRGRLLRWMAMVTAAMVNSARLSRIAQPTILRVKRSRPAARRLARRGCRPAKSD
jgi:hypothetical protein